MVLFLACINLVGNYFCYDNPSVIEDEIQSDLGIDKPKWSLLFTVYSAPNVVLPFLGGVFLDKIGVRFGLILFTALVTLGQAVFMYGGY